MRSKGDLKCSFCKEENLVMIVTSNLNKTFEAFDEGSLIEFKDCNTIFADSSSTLEALVELTSVSCPVEGCMAQSWSRTKSCISWVSEQECRDLLYRRLTTSSHHSDQPGEAMGEVAATCEVTMELVEITEENSKKWQQQKRDHQGAPKHAPTTRHTGVRDDDRLAQVAAAAAVHALQGIGQPQSGTRRNSSLQIDQGI